ncbi:hypothetical protein NB706_001551 [Xanthomonas sacchari]|nr:hypothetical protein [Xanthomonas sacchari]
MTRVPLTPMDLMNRYRDFQGSINSRVPDAARDVSVHLPRSFSDELSFLRLVIWCYVVVQEAARHSLDVATSASGMQRATPVRKSAESLRTYVTHNLERVEDSKRKAAGVWLYRACGTELPVSDSQFETCCQTLALEMKETLDAACKASGLLNHPEDGPRLVATLQERINNKWEAYRFDEAIAAAAERLCIIDVDAKVIRNARLKSFQDAVQFTKLEGRPAAVARVAESALLDLLAESLPWSLERFAAMFKFESAEQLHAMLLIIRSGPRDDVPRILTELSACLDSGTVD